MKTKQLIRDLAKGFAAAKVSDYKRDPARRTPFGRLLEVENLGALSLLAEHLIPILDKHLAEHTVVSRDDVLLLGRLNAKRPASGPHGICCYGDGEYVIVDNRDAILAAIDPDESTATVADILRSLLEAEEVEAVYTPANLMVNDSRDIPDAFTLEMGDDRFTVTRNS